MTSRRPASESAEPRGTCAWAVTDVSAKLPFGADALRIENARFWSERGNDDRRGPQSWDRTNQNQTNPIPPSQTIKATMAIIIEIMVNSLGERRLKDERDEVIAWPIIVLLPRLVNRQACEWGAGLRVRLGREFGLGGEFGLGDQAAQFVDHQ